MSAAPGGDHSLSGVSHHAIRSGRIGPAR
ncbi:hypothetical protein SBRY_50364 [Actinacidiphila bryophytorum]|uniref:Uncharacterized protein n=1 Tax=Actinacidiphila bryophytorum TaxID=1436133 RepID=A0A9W4H4P9_9ACTN|nr:hypothetical protein SBRY_50364 [Actinacidiphila bryophytorum]